MASRGIGALLFTISLMPAARRAAALLPKPQAYDARPPGKHTAMGIVPAEAEVFLIAVGDLQGSAAQHSLALATDVVACCAFYFDIT